MIAETADLGAVLTALKQENPQGYGYLTRYWDDAKQGLDNTARNYARVQYIYENIPERRSRREWMGTRLLALSANLRATNRHQIGSEATRVDLVGGDY